MPTNCTLEKGALTLTLDSSAVLRAAPFPSSLSAPAAATTGRFPVYVVTIVIAEGMAERAPWPRNSSVTCHAKSTKKRERASAFVSPRHPQGGATQRDGGPWGARGPGGGPPFIRGSRTSSTFLEALKREELRLLSFLRGGAPTGSLLIGTGGGGPWGGP